PPFPPRRSSDLSKAAPDVPAAMPLDQGHVLVVEEEDLLQARRTPPPRRPPSPSDDRVRGARTVAAVHGLGVGHHDLAVPNTQPQRPGTTDSLTRETVRRAGQGLVTALRAG